MHKLAKGEVWCCLRFTFFDWQLPKALRHIGRGIKGVGEAARHIAAMWRISVIIHIGHLKRIQISFLICLIALSMFIASRLLRRPRPVIEALIIVVIRLSGQTASLHGALCGNPYAVC